jgi:hypothetical protein
MLYLRLIAAKSLFSRMLHFDLIKQIRFYILLFGRYRYSENRNTLLPIVINW